MWQNVFLCSALLEPSKHPFYSEPCIAHHSDRYLYVVSNPLNVFQNHYHSYRGFLQKNDSHFGNLFVLGQRTVH